MRHLPGRAKSMASWPCPVAHQPPRSTHGQFTSQMLGPGGDEQSGRHGGHGRRQEAPASFPTPDITCSSCSGAGAQSASTAPAKLPIERCVLLYDSVWICTIFHGQAMLGNCGWHEEFFSPETRATPYATGGHPTSLCLHCALHCALHYLMQCPSGTIVHCALCPLIAIPLAVIIASRGGIQRICSGREQCSGMTKAGRELGFVLHSSSLAGSGSGSRSR